VFKRNKVILSCLFSLSLLAIAACSSNVKKADISNSANPQDEIARLDADITAAILKNIDVLAPSEFKNAVKWQDEAKSDLAKKEKQEEILDDVRKGRGYLEKAHAISENQEAKAPGLFEARQAALKAGAAKYPELEGDWKDLDSDVSSKSDNLEKISTDKLAKLQDRYVGLERSAVILSQLGNSQAMLNGARKDGAIKRAPNTFKKSELSLKNAESVISTNVRNPQGFSVAVAEANEDASLLTDVMTTIKQNGKALSEASALKMVSQNRQINNLKTDLSITASAGAATETALQNKNQKLTSELASKEHDLSSAKAKVEIQRVIEKARSQFASDEAEAFQQGDNLLIRMKNVNFASGRSDLPGASLASLAKVSEVAKSLNASEIKVEGHTDSLGSEAQNQTISEQRASAVASYFKSNGFKNIDVQSAGYGFAKPIATNKSKAGRAQNRRVDIIITPETSTTTAQ
jgi:OOP family OmpA-OmpF porin